LVVAAIVRIAATASAMTHRFAHESRAVKTLI
jgi:hypothetical protein